MGESSFGGEVKVGGRLAVMGGGAYLGGNVEFAGGEVFVNGPKLTLGGELKGLGEATLDRNLLVGGAVSALGGAMLGGPLSMLNGGGGVGVVGAPLLMYGAGVTTAATHAPGVSIMGGSAQDGNGGNVHLIAGRMGGTHEEGKVLIQDSFGGASAEITVGAAGITLSAPGGGALGSGIVSVSPLLAVTGVLSIAGGSSFMGNTYTEGNTLASGSLSCSSTVSGRSVVQTASGASGALSYAGVLGGSGWYDPGMITACGASDWSIGGSCYNIFSEDPTGVTSGGISALHVVFYWNFDSVPHSVMYGGANQVWIPIQPGSVFPVYVSNRRRRSLLDFPGVERR